MTLRAFFSSPYMSHCIGPETAILDAMRGLLRIRHRFKVVLGLADIPRQTCDCVWSPLIEGDIIHANGPFSEADAQTWCLRSLDQFNALIFADNIPRRPGAESFCDTEIARMRERGCPIFSATDIEQGRV